MCLRGNCALNVSVLPSGRRRAESHLKFKYVLINVLYLSNAAGALQRCQMFKCRRLATVKDNKEGFMFYNKAEKLGSCSPEINFNRPKCPKRKHLSVCRSHSSKGEIMFRSIWQILPECSLSVVQQMCLKIK